MNAAASPAESQTATAASAYGPDADYLDHITRIYGGPNGSSTAELEAAARERAYLKAIGEALNTTTPEGEGPVATKIEVASHSFIPVLAFPEYDTDNDKGFTVWAEWEGGSHQMDICPFSADRFIHLPDGRTPGDHLRSAAMIRDYLADRLPAETPAFVHVDGDLRTTLREPYMDAEEDA